MNSSSLQNFNKLFNEYYNRFIRFALGYVKEREIAEDFVSEAFTTYWENRENLLPDTKAQAYILTIVKNKCLNHLRHIQVRHRVEKEINQHAEWLLSTSINTLEACDPDFIFSDEIQQIVNSTLNKLPGKTRRVFMLSRYQGLSHRDIADEMNLSTKTVEFHISKALNQLRLSLKDFLILSPLLLYFY
ncbi:MAG: RNA polymerase sigma-70 factor [Bacteroidia bacterium]|nr:RNA polymerase sigma-70 factor [Bacteroidia bacterium]